MNGSGDGASQPAGTWSADQTVAYAVDQIFEQDKFYVVCLDGETTPMSCNTNQYPTEH
jgi:hypothetical protein